MGAVDFTRNRDWEGEIGFDGDLAGRQAAFDQLAPPEFGEGDICIDVSPPCAERAVHRQHRGHRRTRHVVVPVAFVRDAAPRDRLSQTILTDGTVAKEEGVGTAQTKIMQSLDDASIFRSSRIVGGGGNQRKCVMEMDNLRSTRTEYLPALT